ncbi:MAG: pilus assembly PilX N-terminal domain-containing protein [Verrucomicrobiae bacterium]|nr:pilus assembly PilX N-terminal domain-containing protein [Verrucomicrobiae bacterium]
MKRFSNRSGKYGETGSALILTISVLAMILLLVVSFATLTRTDSQSAANYRDYVASRYLAQGALNRAMAQLALQYSSTGGSSNFNTGISSLQSSVTNDPSVFYQYISNANRFATDIEKVRTNTLTGFEYCQAGADDVIDHVVLPGQLADTNLIQWIGMRDTNGVLVGRTAFLITAGGLNINAIGNLFANQVETSIKINSRNEGYSVAEINLPAALMAADSNFWDYASATNGATKILLYRYGKGDGAPPQTGDGLPSTALTAAALNIGADADGRDNDGDGVVDNSEERTGQTPQNFLGLSDGSTSSTIVVADDGGGKSDATIGDLKLLHNGTVTADAAMQLCFVNSFRSIQKWFTTQSSVPVAVSSMNLNDTNYYTIARTNEFFNSVTNKLAMIAPFSTNSVLDRVQLGANITTYAYGDSLSAPFCQVVGTSNVVGVGAFPYINQVYFHVILAAKQVEVAGLPVTTNVEIIVSYAPGMELWYPYTNAFPSTTFTAAMNYKYKNASHAGLNASQAKTASIPFSYSGGGFLDVTNDAHFAKSEWAASTIGASPLVIYKNVSSATPTDVVPVTVSNLEFNSSSIKSGSSYIDWTGYFATNLGCTFLTNQILSAVTNVAVVPVGNSIYLTNTIVLALDDPRVKKWYVEYAGGVSNNVWGTFGGCNSPTNLYSPQIPDTTNIFRPDFGEDCDYQSSGNKLPKGIGPKTFYIKRGRAFGSVAELGRVHRGQPWRTIDLKGGGTDGNVLDCFNIVNTNTATVYAHGKVNINAASSSLPIWAGLFAGVPYHYTKADGNPSDPVWIDILSSGEIDPTFKMCKEFGKIFGSRCGAFSHLGALTCVSDISCLTSNHSSVFQVGKFDAYTDEDKEYLLSRIINLVGTQSQGNMFTIWAWGQALRGPPSDTKKFVTAETLIIAMVRPKLNAAGDKVDLEVIYFRYNPDLELNSF